MAFLEGFQRSRRFFLIGGFMVAFFCSLSWYAVKDRKWDPSIQHSCEEYWFRINGQKENRLQRMLYPKPETLKPPYIRFLKPFIETAEKFFMVGLPVNYYVFTDQASNVTDLNIIVGTGRQIIILEVPSYERWQDVTMRRMQMISDVCQQRFASEVDYLVCVDVDMRFQDHVGVEILSDVFGTLHPAFFVKGRDKFTYERRPESQAYIPEDEGDFYYAGGYFGGKVEEVYKLTNHCHHAMLTDKANNIEAIWHDESYLNSYFLYNKKPTKILSPEYLWNEMDGTAFYLRKIRFIALQKNMAEVRT
eukprot:XP_017945251.1 PREDICTED: ABO blood group (alpha 1-3-N-acetylgalactosaminyltransferase, alpha 1-3-galactosyltransferase) isoform X3 [Xenopus tropicalis]